MICPSFGRTIFIDRCFTLFVPTGIEVKFKNQSYPILIAPTHIPELTTVEHTSDGITFGASVTLTIMGDVLNEACHSMPGANAQLFLPHE